MEEANSIHISLQAFAAAREALGFQERAVSLPQGSTITDLLAYLVTTYPGFEALQDRMVVTVNQVFASRDQVLCQSDQVAVFPPVSGGVSETHVALSASPLDEVSQIDRVTEPGTGAIVTFRGVVRNENLGRRVSHLEYEAFAEMAMARLRQVVEEARDRWPLIRRVSLVHRTGRMDIGETAVLIAVGAAHRNDGAFEAARYAIDRVKEIVPIWKKEAWSEGEEWLEGDYRPTAGE